MEERVLDTEQQLLKRYSRRSVLAAGALGIGATAFLVACGGDDDDDGAATGATGATGSTGSGGATGATGAVGSTGEMMEHELALVHGWYKGKEVQYYDFGANTPLTTGSSVATAPIYVFISGMDASGNPEFVEDQHNIIAVKPGDEGYSDLWQVMLVTAGDDYEADSVKSAADVMSGGFEVTETQMFVNCPVVEEGTTLEGGEAIVQGWYNNEAVFYPDFGANPPVAIPIWVFITGVDASGSPQFVEGQMNVIDAVPGDAAYSAFWRVNLVKAPEGYVANMLKSADEIRDMQYTVEETDMNVNCPVTVF
jgi:hypothetical protein